VPRQEKDKGEQFVIIWSWHGSQTRASGGEHFTTILKKNKNLLKGNAKRIYEAVVKGGSVDNIINTLSSDLNSFATQFKKIGNVILDNDNLILKSSSGEELGRIINGKLVISDAQIIKIPKGYRPSPKLYMTAEEIAEYLKKFENEGIVSRIVLKDDYKTYGVGKPDETEFVSLKSDIDKLLKETNGNIDLMSEALGIDKEKLKGGLVRIDFKINSSNQISMPSGNEFGTNEKWIPRGKLPTGKSEVIVITKGMNENINYTVKEITN